MTKTVDFPYKTEDTSLIEKMCSQYTSMYHYAYNRFVDGLKEKDIRLLSKKLNNIETLDSWFIQCAIKDAEGQYKARKEEGNTNIIFGSRHNFKLRAKGKISKEQYKERRIVPMMIQGEKLHKGNRKFELDIKNNKIIFYPKKGIEIELQLPDIRNNYKKQLETLQFLTAQKQIPFCIRLTKERIYISFDLPEKNDNIVNDKRCLGIDLNPNYIGISVLEFNKNDEYEILHKEAFDLSELTVKSGKASNDKVSKYLHNKLQFETIQICKRISEIAVQFNCKFIFIEELKNINKSKTSNNRLNKNKWLKTLVVQQLEKRCEFNNMKLYRVNPAYSSIIGNLQHDYFDPINSSIEIARRGFNCIILKNKKFYPELKLKYDSLHLWKKKDGLMFESWNEIFEELKNSKLRYRVLLKDTIMSFNVLSFKSRKSNVNCYVFV